jgi:hypothetical protein
MLYLGPSLLHLQFGPFSHKRKSNFILYKTSKIIVCFLIWWFIGGNENSALDIIKQVRSTIHLVLATSKKFGLLAENEIRSEKSRMNKYTSAYNFICVFVHIEQ